MHRLKQEAPFIYEQLLKDTGCFNVRLAALIDQLSNENTIICLQRPNVSNDGLDEYYFNLIDSDEVKAYEYFYAARLLSAKEFLDENNLVDAVYELIHAFEDEDKIKQVLCTNLKQSAE